MKKSFNAKLFLGLVIFSMLFVTAKAAVGDLDTASGTNGAARPLILTAIRPKDNPIRIRD